MGTLYMPLAMALIAVLILVASVAALIAGNEPEQHLLVSEGAMTPFLVAVVAAWVMLRPLYIRHAKHNSELHPERRKRWLFALRFYGPFVAPRYWWLYIRSWDAS